ncbi:hypothetical protein ACFSJS_26415 [Streptomyces desertarenae]|uniref:Uncharacterized protein n=1 Tax=Streptomyces desertarenae TaxID=2666184 RepID=A0ABW4PS17_9ACTN
MAFDTPTRRPASSRVIPERARNFRIIAPSWRRRVVILGGMTATFLLCGRLLRMINQAMNGLSWRFADSPGRFL